MVAKSPQTADCRGCARPMTNLVSAALALHVPEWRGRRTTHPLPELVRQRVFQIACGYEDQDDADTLRKDPLLKLVCGSLPETGKGLASQPTISRLENAVTARSCYRMAMVLRELYIRARGKDGAPERLLLDFDSTDDPAHGEQEGTHYHGYFEGRIYHPLLVFDGETGQLITAVLRPGNAHASHGALSMLKRIVKALRQAWPSVESRSGPMPVSPYPPSMSTASRKASATL